MLAVWRMHSFHTKDYFKCSYLPPTLVQSSFSPHRSLNDHKDGMFHFVRAYVSQPFNETLNKWQGGTKLLVCPVG